MMKEMKPIYILFQLLFNKSRSAIKEHEENYCECFSVTFHDFYLFLGAFPSRHRNKFTCLTEWQDFKRKTSPFMTHVEGTNY